MEADFSGYATKAGLKCSDGRTIMPDAFKHQDKMQVPLVWQHGHTDPENVLGHAILENREDGVYAYGFFNKSGKAEHARGLVEHNDIRAMSIWANDLIERAGRVLHGAIREVSLVLAGANPGAFIENVNIRHSDGDVETLDDEVIIYTGLELQHSAEGEGDEEEQEEEQEDEEDQEEEDVKHAAGDDSSDETTIQDVYDSMTDQQKDVLHYMIGEALASVQSAKHDNVNDANDSTNDDDTKGQVMKHNVFEGDKKEGEKDVHFLSHDDIKGIVAEASKNGSLKDAVENYALAHGIENIDLLFPDAVAIDNVPEFLKRRTEWVNHFLGGSRKSPFSRIKTLHADITEDEARAKGYIKGNLKKEEFFSVARRITTPTTVYKKQKLDRDDMIDITDFDVVTWLKAEMRLMLDEEIARAALIGDGRDPSSEDKISEQCIRPINGDHELYAVTINVNLGDANSSIAEVVDAIILNRHNYKGSGLPAMYTTETVIAQFLLLKDTLGRRIYKNLEEIASELRVTQVVPVEVMEEVPDVVAIIVNPNDYVFGATRGGEVSMFDDFDIDYNQYKYLIETRLSGALTKLKSALVVKTTAAANVLVKPAAPTFDGAAVTITDTIGVDYKDGSGAALTAATNPHVVAPGSSLTVNATPTSGHYFASSEDDSWTFTNNN